MKPKDSLLTQVDLRLSILDEWLVRREIPWKKNTDGTSIRDENGELIPDFAPVNLLQFCEWTPDRNCHTSGIAIASLRRISRMSLHQPYHAELRKRVGDKLKMIKACLKLQIERGNKVSIIEEQAAEIRLLKKIVDAQARESRFARQAVTELTEKYRHKHEEQRRIILQLKEDLACNEEKIASLTATLSKVKPLRLARRTGEAE